MVMVWSKSCQHVNPRNTACLVKVSHTEVIVLMVFDWCTDRYVCWMAAQAVALFGSKLASNQVFRQISEPACELGSVRTYYTSVNFRAHECSAASSSFHPW